MLGAQLFRGAKNEFRIREWRKRNACHLSHWSGSYQSRGQGMPKKHDSKNTVGDLCLSVPTMEKETDSPASLWHAQSQVFTGATPSPFRIAGNKLHARRLLLLPAAPH